MKFGYIVVKQKEVGLAHMEFIVYFGERHEINIRANTHLIASVLCTMEKKARCCERCRGTIIQICELLKTPFEVRFKLNSEG